MGFVYEHPIYAQLVERHHLVALTSQRAQLLHLRFQIRLDLLHVAHDATVSALALHCFDGVGYLVYLFFVDTLFYCWVEADLGQRGMPDNHRVVFA